MTTREEVYAAIDSERDYQDDRFKAPVIEGARRLETTALDRDAIDRSLDEFLLYIHDYTQEAIRQTTRCDEQSALNTVRKVAALCVGCMEKHGAPKR